MNSVTVGEYLAKRLEEIGLRDYFAIPGDFNLTLLDELLKNPYLNMINCCNELNAGYAADGYARENGVSALVLTFSVGGLSAVNAIAGAYAESLPIIVISGGPNINSITRQDTLHHTLAKLGDSQDYVRAIFQNITAHTAVIRKAADAPYLIDQAIMIALKTKKPVYIEIACNLSDAMTSYPHPLKLKSSPQSDKDSLAAALEHVSHFLNAAHNPVLVAGANLRSTEAIEAFTNLSTHCEYGIACMPNAKGFISEQDPHFIGIYWGSASSPGCREIVESSDAYLFGGPIFSDYTTVGFSSLINPKKLINASPDRILIEGQSYQGIILSEFFEQLTLKLRKNRISMDTYQQIKGESPPPQKTKKEAPLTTRFVFSQIDKMLTSQTTLVVETGDSWFNGIRLHLPEGCKFEIQMQYGSIGWSVGAFLGVAAANPDRKVIGLIGDGSFQMSAQEISTFMRYNYSGIIFLFNNSGYTIEVKIHDGPYNSIQNWQYAQLIDIFKDQNRGWSTVVRTEQELLEAIKKAKHFKGLALIEVYLDRNDCNKLLLSWGMAVADYNSKPVEV